MNAEETARLLAKCASFDRRKIGELDIIAWLEVLGDLPYRDCEQAVTGHYSDSTDWIMPAHIRQRVKAMRRDRVNREVVAAPPPELTGEPGRYRDELRARVRDIADGRSLKRAIGVDNPVEGSGKPGRYTDPKGPGNPDATPAEGSGFPGLKVRRTRTLHAATQSSWGET